MGEPRQVTAVNGDIRWMAADERTFASLEDARLANANLKLDPAFGAPTAENTPLKSSKAGPPEKPYLAYAALWVGVAAIIVAVFIGISYAFQWLKYGSSDPYPMTGLFNSLGLSYPRVSWVGIQRIIDWIMACPAGVVLFFAGFVLSWAGGSVTEDFERAASSYRYRKQQEEDEVRRAAERAASKRSN